MSTRDTKNSAQKLKEEKILVKLPAKEISWVKSTSQTGKIFYTTSNPERTQYYLYEKVENGFQRIAKAATPVNFNQIVYPPEEPQVMKKPKKKSQQ